MQVIGLIGGTGMDAWPGECEKLVVETPYGPPSTPLSRFTIGDAQLLFIARHGKPHEVPPHRVNYRANLWALRELGAQAVLAINAVGGLTVDTEPGVMVLPDQLVDYTWGREHTFWDARGQAMNHVDFTDPFDATLRDQLLVAAEQEGLPVLDRGCIGVTQGPRLETAAEIRRLERDGCTLVGMTSMPEAALARELGLPYASLCVVANWAAGLSPEPISMADIETTLAWAMRRARRIVSAFIGVGGMA